MAARTGGRRRGGTAARGWEALGCGAGVVESRRSSPESAGIASRGRERERRAGEREGWAREIGAEREGIEIEEVGAMVFLLPEKKIATLFAVRQQMAKNLCRLLAPLCRPLADGKDSLPSAGRWQRTG